MWALVLAARGAQCHDTRGETCKELWDHPVSLPLTVHLLGTVAGVGINPFAENISRLGTITYRQSSDRMDALRTLEYYTAVTMDVVATGNTMSTSQDAKQKQQATQKRIQCDPLWLKIALLFRVHVNDKGKEKKAIILKSSVGCPVGGGREQHLGRQGLGHWQQSSFGLGWWCHAHSRRNYALNRSCFLHYSVYVPYDKKRQQLPSGHSQARMRAAVIPPEITQLSKRQSSFP